MKEIVENALECATNSQFYEDFLSRIVLRANDLPLAFGKQRKPKQKYFKQRYDLLSKIEQCHIPDDVSWYSVTPERIAKVIAEKAQGLVIDLFCGIGGNSIQFALRGCLVLGIDNNHVRIRAAKHNAAVYGARSADFVRGDSLAMLRSLRADVIFLSPPWGGPNYSAKKQFCVKKHIRVGGLDGVQLARRALDVCPNLIYYLPRTIDIDSLHKLLSECGQSRCLLESNYIDGKLKAKTLYIGPLFNHQRPAVISEEGLVG